MSEPYDSIPDTTEHIGRVQLYMDVASDEIRARAEIHDRSKLQSPEKEAFDTATPLLRDLTYGSDEYRAALRDLKPALDHHYAKNDHHPEFERASGEVWRAVVGFEDAYEVSNLGEIRSIDRVVPRKGKQGSMQRKGELLSPHLTPKGYQRVQLSKRGRPANRFVHVLVAEAFIGPRPAGLEVNHKDGVKQNNRDWNLEWATPTENLQHAYDNGLKLPVAKHLVTCELPDGEEIVTAGCNKMAEELVNRGYKATPVGVWNAAVGDGKKHVGLCFKAEPLATAANYSGITGMSLFSLVEMVCDWKAASERHANGDFSASLEINRKRFGIDDQLYSVICNTARQMGFIGGTN